MDYRKIKQMKWQVYSPFAQVSRKVNTNRLVTDLHISDKTSKEKEAR